MPSRRRKFVLVTRPAGEGRRTIAALSRAGWRGISAPVLTVEPLKTTSPPTPSPDAVLVTSGNALSAAAKHGGVHNWAALPLFAVGDRTAEMARKFGFLNVQSADGNSSALISLCIDRLKEPNSILHVTGAGLGMELSERLRDLGHAVTRWETYRTAPAKHFSSQARWLLGRRQVGSVLLLSPRSATTYAALIQKHQLAGAVKAAKLVCISATTAQALLDSSGGNQLLNVCIAQKPNLGSVIDALSLEARPAGTKFRRAANRQH